MALVERSVEVDLSTESKKLPVTRFVLTALGVDSVSNYHGSSGHVHAPFPREMFTGPQQPVYIDAVSNLTGMSYCADALGGNSNCVTYLPMSINPEDNYHGSSLAIAYLTPVESNRTDWLILINHQVKKVLLSRTLPNVTATGVQFKKSDETSETYRKCSLLVSLDHRNCFSYLSIWDRRPVNLGTARNRCKGRSTDCWLKLPRPDWGFTQPFHPSSYNRGGRGPDNVYAFDSLEQLLAESAGHLLAYNDLSADALTQVFRIQAGLITNSSGITCCRNLLEQWNIQLLKYSSFDGIATGEPVNHGIGSAAMMRRDLGRVIDGSLRVYDTTNVRVVGGSIRPLHVSAHPSSTLYGVAEKAADIIKSGKQSVAYDSTVQLTMCFCFVIFIHVVQTRRTSTQAPNFDRLREEQSYSTPIPHDSWRLFRSSRALVFADELYVFVLWHFIDGGDTIPSPQFVPLQNMVLAFEIPKQVLTFYPIDPLCSGHARTSLAFQSSVNANAWPKNSLPVMSDE
ncbi:uncharacterized protein FOMMEDRAFT_160512 [Fomitiporia mediterranea MF3/22]|uniref:uncharacterized protein n=1 Tax=Fomitiporia mediterranea (strain MF3/22) TaxID=694068 RepID=UPI0004407725|nr:uncharacterized protein FOMMEDRAFT_160512 [Fomitiporia mediterranea MF3/22]EJC99458.1 hypothetical protein FOMMEDRAFT_160512 [Fomitiporia mediterranea MF3/22]